MKNIDAKRFPGKWLLENTLSKVASKEQRIWPNSAFTTSKCNQKPQMCNSNILRFIDDSEIENRITSCFERIRESCE